MPPFDRLIHWGAGVLLDPPARRPPLPAFHARLAASGAKLDRRLESLPDRPANRRRLSHIVGIERWGQRRLRAALGEPLLGDEYDSYRPPSTCTWAELRTEFSATRRLTLDLITALDPAEPSTGLKIPHNGFGPLTVRAWLRYLDLHANIEAMKLK